MTQIARQMQSASDGDGTFRDFYHPAINDAGQVVFGVTFQTSRIERGIVFYDDALGLVQVARVGDPLLGSKIVNIVFDGREPLAFNERGQVAFEFFLEDHRRGIAIWSPVPEPGSIVLLVLAFAGFPTFRRWQ